MLQFDASWLIRGWGKTIRQFDKIRFMEWWAEELLEACRRGDYYAMQDLMLREKRYKGYA